MRMVSKMVMKMVMKKMTTSKDSISSMDQTRILPPYDPCHTSVDDSEMSKSYLSSTNHPSPIGCTPYSYGSPSGSDASPESRSDYHLQMTHQGPFFVATTRTLPLTTPSLPSHETKTAIHRFVETRQTTRQETSSNETLVRD